MVLQQEERIDIEIRVSRLEGETEQINHRLADLRASVELLQTTLNARMNSLETSVNAGMSAIETRMNVQLAVMFVMWASIMAALITIIVRM